MWGYKTDIASLYFVIVWRISRKSRNINIEFAFCISPKYITIIIIVCFCSRRYYSAAPLRIDCLTFISLKDFIVRRQAFWLRLFISYSYKHRIYFSTISPGIIADCTGGVYKNQNSSLARGLGPEQILPSLK